MLIKLFNLKLLKFTLAGIVLHASLSETRSTNNRICERRRQMQKRARFGAAKEKRARFNTERYAFRK